MIEGRAFLIAIEFYVRLIRAERAIFHFGQRPSFTEQLSRLRIRAGLCRIARPGHHSVGDCLGRKCGNVIPSEAIDDGADARGAAECVGVIVADEIRRETRRAGKVNAGEGSNLRASSSVPARAFRHICLPSTRRPDTIGPFQGPRYTRHMLTFNPG